MRESNRRGAGVDTGERADRQGIVIEAEDHSTHITICPGYVNVSIGKGIILRHSQSKADRCMGS